MHGKISNLSLCEAQGEGMRVMKSRFYPAILAVACILAETRSEGVPPPSQANDLTPARLNVPSLWEYSAPLIAPEPRQRDPSRAQKDPTVVWHGGE